MGSHIPLGSIEALFNAFVHPYRCQCRLLKDATLVISVQDGDLQDTYLTVAGVTAEQCCDERHIRSLACSILEELSAVREASPSTLDQADFARLCNRTLITQS